ncbi:hypothetical protein DCC85_16390 [Paenibacillus sp. CAA11]|uniref:hypothetical protein n=1 Tax=Paenibacillus sp. CAA11 TaxID=1532905 RepID=UPI000D335896|nr:hypothetical protein [Paenibacillus sp. CAA11]AWB45618.1 hypothetical protein DCC85_16390 [Paenibacillus sp. CAA11]
MFEITYNEQSNQITCAIRSITMEEVIHYIEYYKQAVQQAKPGFIVLGDLSLSRRFPQQVAVALASLGPISQEHGIAKWAFYAPSVTLRIQMKQMFGSMAASFDSLEEAQAYLTAPVKTIR